MIITLPVTRLRPLPHALTHPTGITFLPPNLRVSTEELNRQDAQWRALREAAYNRAWAEDATLVGSIISYGNGEAGAERRGGHASSRRKRKRALLKLIKWMEVGAGSSATRSSHTNTNPADGTNAASTTTSQPLQ